MKRYIHSAKESQKFTVECYRHHSEDPTRNRFDSYRSAISFALDSVNSNRYEDVIITSPGVNGPSVINSWSKDDGWYKDPSVTSSQEHETYQLYRNNRNENKYIESRKSTDGHTVRKYISSAVIGDYRGYDLCAENSSPQRYYFVDDFGKVHYAENEEQLQPEIDKWIRDHRIRSSKNIDKDHEEFFSLEEIIFQALQKSGGDLDDFQGDIRHSSYLCDQLILSFDTMSDDSIPREKFKKSVRKNIEEALERTRFSDNIDVYIDLQSRDFVPADMPEEMKSHWFHVYVEAWANDTETVSSSILSSEIPTRDGKKPYVVFFTYDKGDRETGPLVDGGQDLVWANSEDEACEIWKDEYLDPNDETFSGCNAQLANKEELIYFDEYYEDDEPEDYDDDEYQIYFFLQDVAQETGTFDYEDMSDIELTPEVSDKLYKFMYSYMAAADDGNESKCNQIGKSIAKYLKTLR